MKVRVITEIDISTGDYDMKFCNLSRPGEAIDYWLLSEALRRTFADFERQVEAPQAPQHEGVIKEVH